MHRLLILECIYLLVSCNMLHNCIYITIYCYIILMYYLRQKMLPNICLIFSLGMHYLHKEAPVKVIHRDLKSKNGNF